MVWTRITEWSVRSGRGWGAHPGPSPHPLPGWRGLQYSCRMALIPTVRSLSPGVWMFTSWIFCILVQMFRSLTLVNPPLWQGRGGVLG